MIRLFLMGQKGLDSLKAIQSEEMIAMIHSVVVGEDKNVQNDFSNEIRAYCSNKGIAHTSRTEAGNRPAKVTHDIAISWRWLLAETNNLIVFHDSLLPKYRGFNPLVTALINGDTQIGVTALFASGEFDAGPIISQKKIDIRYPIKLQDAIEKLGGAYAELMTELLNGIAQNTLESIEQNENEVSYSLWRDEDDYEIDWSLNANDIQRFIDSVGFPYKGAKTLVDGETVRIMDAEALADVAIANRTPGKVLFKREGHFDVVCGQGLLRLKDIRTENGERFTSNKFRLRFGK